MLAVATMAAAASARAKASGNQRSNQSERVRPSEARAELSCGVSWGFRASAMWREYTSEAAPQTSTQAPPRWGSVYWPALRAGGPDIIKGCSLIKLMANLGFVGLGAMGSRITKRLLAKGHTV